MVVVFCKEGKLANRLWQAAHFFANALENDYKLLHVGFSEYREYFSESFDELRLTSKIKVIDDNNLSFFEALFFRYLRLSKKIQRKFHFKFPFVKEVYFSNFSSIRYNISEDNFLALCNNNIVLVDGWFFNDRSSVIKFSNQIKNILKPNADSLKNVELLKKKHFSLYDIVVGVHIRRGDYQTYRDGTWFYAFEEYANFMDKIRSLTPFKDKKIGFLLCSNEQLDYSAFHRFNVIVPTQHFIEDLIALSVCDYIIGPPSTYSGWASFYGNVPLLQIIDKSQNISESMFNVVECWF
jgi:hypothetical protein